MGRIGANVTISNPLSDKVISAYALVDTGASHLILPAAWRERLEDFKVSRRVPASLANGRQQEMEICGPVLIAIDGFGVIASEVAFMDMAEPEVLLGYIPLEQAFAGVDLVGHRLFPVGTADARRTIA